MNKYRRHRNWAILFSLALLATSIFLFLFNVPYELAKTIRVVVPAVFFEEKEILIQVEPTPISDEQLTSNKDQDSTLALSVASQAIAQIPSFRNPTNEEVELSYLMMAQAISMIKPTTATLPILDQIDLRSRELLSIVQGNPIRTDIERTDISEDIRAMDFDPESGHLALGDINGDLWIFDENEQYKRIFSTKGNPDYESAGMIRDLDFVQSKNLLLTGHDTGKIKFWDVDKIPAPYLFEVDHGQTVRAIISVSIQDDAGTSTDDYFISSGDNRKILFWELDGTLRSNIELASNEFQDLSRIRALAIDEKHQLLAAAITLVRIDNDGDSFNTSQILIWSLNNLQAEPIKLEAGDSEIYSLVFDSTQFPINEQRKTAKNANLGRLLAGNDNGDLQIWEIVSPESLLQRNQIAGPIELSQYHGDDIYTLRFYPSRSSVASSSADGTIKILNLESLNSIIAGINTASSISSPSTSQDEENSSLLSDQSNSNVEIDINQTIEIIDRNLENLNLPIQTLRGLPSEIRNIQFDRTGKRLFSSGVTGTVSVWNLSAQLARQGHSGEVSDVSFSPNELFLASAGLDGKVFLWRTANLGEDFNEEKQLNPFSIDRLNQEVSEWVGNPAALDFSSNSNWFAVAGHISSPDGNRASKIIVWEVGGGEPAWKSIYDTSTDQTQKNTQIEHLKFGNSGEWFITAGTEEVEMEKEKKTTKGFINLWGENFFQNPSPLNLQCDCESHSVTALAISPDDQFIVTAWTDNVLRVWNKDTLPTSSDTTPIFTSALGHSGMINTLDHHPSNSWIVSASNNGDIFITDFLSLEDEEIKKIPLLGHEDAVLEASFSASGDWLISSGKDSTLRLWDLRELNESHSLTSEAILIESQIVWTHESPITSAQFSANDNWISASTSDGIVHIWPFNNQPQNYYCKQLRTNFTLTHWQEKEWELLGLKRGDYPCKN